jgi:3'-phosphoadenosine 5'-phosphosulfate sulfotransferase (PAPS reductase)/FAD synthetase
MLHVVFYSGGIGSWAAAKRVAKEHGTDGLVMLFADTKIEDEDLYRFLHESAGNVGGELVIVQHGLDPWEIFKQERFLGNSRIDPCSKILKRQLLRSWINKHCDPSVDRLYMGIDWSESHRADRSMLFWQGWDIRFPMCDPPYIDKHEMISDLEEGGGVSSKVISNGFPT